MESRLDSIFRTNFRTTENADTGMGVRREDPHDDGRRKKDDGDHSAEKPVWEDDAVVSIAALQQFLTTLIVPDSEFQKPSETAPAISTQPLSPQQQRAHNAASAYQTTARHSPRAPVNITPEAVPDSPTLSPEENRIIHQLMNDLDALLQNGVTSLTIQKDGSFLESLSRAARMMLDSIR